MNLAVIILMLVFNAVLTAYEMGLASISRARISILVNEHKKGAADAAFMKDRMEASLAVIQLGITLFATIAAASGGAGAEAAFAPYLAQTWHISMTLAEVIAVTFIIIPLMLATIIFAELVPKMFALNNKEWIVLRLVAGYENPRPDYRPLYFRHRSHRQKNRRRNCQNAAGNPR